MGTPYISVAAIKLVTEKSCMEKTGYTDLRVLFIATSYCPPAPRKAEHPTRNVSLSTIIGFVLYSPTRSITYPSAL